MSRAVYVDLVDSNDIKGFLGVFHRFLSIRGYPNTIRLDLGSQLVSASKEIKLDRSNLECSANCGITWIFNKSADAPWQNDCSEALIKSVKHPIAIAIGDSKLTFGEMQTVLFATAALLNARPIGMKPGSGLELETYMRSNDLILGRASSKTPSCTNVVHNIQKQRLEFMDRITDSFWKKMADKNGI